MSGIEYQTIYTADVTNDIGELHRSGCQHVTRHHTRFRGEARASAPALMGAAVAWILGDPSDSGQPINFGWRVANVRRAPCIKATLAEMESAYWAHYGREVPEIWVGAQE